MLNFDKSLFKKRSLTLSELSSFTRKFAALMASAPPVTGVIDLLSKQMAGEKVSKTLSLIAANIKSGSTTSHAFQKHELIFGTFFCSMITQGEASGNLGDALLKSSEYFEKRDGFRKKITHLLKYPLIIILGATGCFVSLLFFIVPQGLQKVWINSNNLPPATKVIVSTITFIQTHTPEIAIVFIVIMILFLLLWHSNHKSPWVSSFAWNLPTLGDILRKNSLQRFSLSLSTLLSSGLNCEHALTILARELRNSHLEKRILNTLVDTINDSKSIFIILKKISIFPPLIIAMAENEKKLNHSYEQIKKIAVFYQDEVEAAFNAFAIIIGPVFVSVIGLLGLGVIISLYLPVFKLVGNQ